MAYRRIGYIECKDYIALGPAGKVCGSGQAILAGDRYGPYRLDTEVIYMLYFHCVLKY